MAQLASTTGLSAAQNTIIDAARYTQEHNTPSWQLIEKLTLSKGSSTRLVPKVGRFTISDLTDGEDMTDEQAIGMTNVSLTATERGAKVIASDKLVRQNGTTDIWKIVGRQFGDAGAVKTDTDTQALYSGLNSGTTFGAAAALMTLNNFAAMVSKARGGNTASGRPFRPTYCVQHPNSVFTLARTGTPAMAPTANQQRVSDSAQDKLLQNFFMVRYGQVNVYDSGELVPDSADDTIGVIAEKGALVGLTSVGWHTERERDASRRATELNFTADYGVFELDNDRGAPCTFGSQAPTDTT